jgi:urease accessory protein
MHRVSSIAPAGQWPESAAIDRVVLDAEDRNRRRIALTTETGTKILLDFDKPASLRDGDGLVLEDGTIVRVCGLPEDIVEVTASSPREFARLAWHLGNRHTPVQIMDEALRMRRDHVLEHMLLHLGAKLEPMHAAFDPEAGAAQHGHHDNHAHGDDHHHHHGHSHGE